MKKIVIALVIIVVLVGGYMMQRDTEPEQTIKIGVMAPLTGFLANFGAEMKRGIDTVDAKGIEFVFEDDQCDTAPALNAYRKLTEIDQVQFIVGPGCGAPQEAIAPLVADADVVAIVPFSAARNLHDLSQKKMFFTQYALEDESAAIAEKMLALGHRKVVLISFKNVFAETHAQTFREHFKGEIVAELSFTNSVTDVASELVKIKDLEFDAIFSPDLSFLFAQGAARLKAYGITAQVFSPYATELPSVRPLTVDRMIYSFPDNVGKEGAVYELSKLAAEGMVDAVEKCSGEYACVLETLRSSDEYDQFGVRKQGIVFKQIVDGQAVPFKD